MDSRRRIIRLVGVYDAIGTRRGEVSYWIGARLGRAHCSLCDITHGTFRTKSAWRQCRDGLPVEFDTYHRDDQPDAVRTATADLSPTVVAETDSGIVVLLAPPALEACAGSVGRFVEAIERAVERHGLGWPGE